ncbi:MAG: TetR family transcriptional regulator [Flavobacteriales bacterium]|nr:TetR family transcriptional regulator [Flavobacteriales bacterium]
MALSTSRRTYARGLATREEILEGALPVFNQHGDHTTLELLARELELSKGRITHHFPTKDLLLEGLLERYEQALNEAGRLPDGPWHLADVAASFGRSLDVIVAYQYIAVAHSTAITLGSRIHERVKESFARRLQSMRPFAEYLVHLGLLKEEVLGQRHFDTWSTALVMCFVAWPIHHQNVAAHLARSLSRSIALRACMNTMAPYLTAKGRLQYQEVFDAL